MNRLNSLTAEKKVEASDNNFISVNKTTQQTATKNVFTNIIYNTTVEKRGWVYNNATGIFTCNQKGKYMVDCVTLIGITPNSNNNVEVASVRATLNGVEVIGTAITKVFVGSGQWINSFILSANSGDSFAVQFTGNSGQEIISSSPAIAGETITLATVRITLGV